MGRFNLSLAVMDSIDYIISEVSTISIIAFIIMSLIDLRLLNAESEKSDRKLITLQVIKS
jgi:hypothetical protein